MGQLETSRFTIGVFQDVAWAERGIEALKRAGFPPEALTVLAKDSPEATSLIARTLGRDAQQLELPNLGAAVTSGPLVEALGGLEGDLGRAGLAASMRRVGFQAHDGRIFDTLASRGGVLVAITGEARAADALAILHSYGGGNAAIGAWTGRV